MKDFRVHYLVGAGKDWLGQRVQIRSLAITSASDTNAWTLPCFHFEILGVLDQLTFWATSKVLVRTTHWCGSPALYPPSIRADVLFYPILNSRREKAFITVGLGNPRFEFWKRTPGSKFQTRDPWAVSISSRKISKARIYALTFSARACRLLNWGPPFLALARSWLQKQNSHQFEAHSC